MIRKSFFHTFLCILILFLWSQGHAVYGKSYHHRSPLTKPHFVNSFLRCIVQSKVFPLQQEKDMADVMETLRQAMEAGNSFQKDSPAKTQALKYAFASVIADLVVRFTKNSQTVSLEVKKKVVRSCLEKSFQETEGHVDNFFVTEIDNLIGVFSQENEYKDNSDYDETDDFVVGAGLDMGSNLGVDLGVSPITGVNAGANLGTGGSIGTNFAFNAGLGPSTSNGFYNNAGLGSSTNLGFGAGLNFDTSFNANSANPGYGSWSGFNLDKENWAVNSGIGMGAAFDSNIILQFKNRLAAQLKATGILNPSDIGSLKNYKLSTLAKLIVQNLASNFRFQLDVQDINDLYNTLQSNYFKLDVIQMYESLSDFTGKLLSRKGMLNNMNKALSLSLQSTLTAISQTLNLYINIQAMMDFAMANTGTYITPGLSADIGAVPAASFNSDKEFGFKTDFPTGLDADLTAGFSVGAGLTAGANVNIGIDKLNIILTTALKASRAFESVQWNTITRQDLMNLSRNIVARFGSKMGIQLGTMAIRDVSNLLLSSDINKGTDANCELFAKVLFLLLEKQGFLTNISTEVIRSCIEIILTSCLPVLKTNIDIGLALDLALKAVNTGLRKDAGAALTTDLGLDSELTNGAYLQIGFDGDFETSLLNADLEAGLNADLEADFGAYLKTDIGFGVGQGFRDNIDNNVDKFKMILTAALKASGAFDSVIWNTINRQDLLNLSKAIITQFRIKMGIQLGPAEIKDVLNIFLSSDVNKGIDASCETLANISVLLLQKQGLLVNISTDLIRSCLEIILTSCLPALKIDIDLRLALDQAVIAVENLGASIGLGIDANIDAGAAAKATLEIDRGLRLGTSPEYDLNTNLNAGTGVENRLQVGVNAESSLDKLKIVLVGSIKASKAFDIVQWNNITRQDLVNLAKNIVARFESKLGIQIGNADKKDVLNLLLSADLRKGIEANCELFANVLTLLIKKQNLSVNISKDLIQSYIEIILTSCFSVLKIDIDFGSALDRALKAAINLGASIGLKIDADVNPGLGVDAEASINADVELDAGLQLGTKLQADLSADVNAGVGISDEFAIKANANISVDKFKIILIRSLKASKVFDSVAWNEIPRQDLVNLAKTIVVRFGSKLGIQLGVADVKDVLNLMLSTDISKGSDANCDLFANILLLLLQKQTLLANISADLIQSCIETILLSCSSALKINFDLKLALELALKSALNLETSVDLQADAKMNTDVGVNAGADLAAIVGVDEGLGLGENVQPGLNADINADIGAEAVLGLGAGVDMSVDKLNLIFVGALKATKVFDSVAWNTITRQDLLSLSKTIVTRFGSKFGIKLGIADVKDVLNFLLSADISKGVDEKCEIFANILFFLLQKQGLLANISIDLIQSCIEVVLSSCSSVLKINIDLESALKAALNIKAVRLGLDADLNADFRVNAGARVASGGEIDAGLDLGGDIQSGLEANFNADIGAEATLGLGTDAGMIVNRLKIIFAGALKASKALDSAAWNTITRQDLVNLSKTIVTRFGSKIGKQLGIADVKDILKLMLSADVTKGTDANCDLLANILISLLQKQDLLTNISTNLTQSCIEIILSSCLSVLKINTDLEVALGQAVKAAVNIGASLGQRMDVNVNAGLGVNADAVVGIDSRVGIGADTQTGLDTVFNEGKSTEARLGLTANGSNSVDKFKNLLVVALKASKAFDSVQWNAISMQDFLNLANTIVVRFGNKFGIQLGNADIKDVLNFMLSSDLKKGTDANCEIFANISALLLQKQGLLANISTNLIRSCIEIILSSCSSGLNINTDLTLAIDLAINAVGNLGAFVDLENGTGINADLGAEADVITSLRADTGLQANLGADVNAGIAVNDAFGLEANADFSFEKLKNILVGSLKASKIFNSVTWNAITRQDLINLSRTITASFGSELGIQLGIEDIKQVLRILLSADLNKGTDANCELFANISVTLLQKKDLLTNISTKTLRSCIEIILKSCFSVLKINIDFGLALDLALKAAVNLGASIGLKFDADVNSGLGVDAEASINDGLGLDAGFQLGTEFKADLGAYVNAGVGASDELSIKANANISVDKLKIILIGSLKACKVFDSVAWNAITRQDLLNLSKTIVARFGSKLGIQLGVADVKDVLNLLLSADITKGSDANCELFANILVLLLQKQALLANISPDLIQSCIEIILSSCSSVMKINIDLGKAFELALKAALNLETSFGLEVDTKMNTDLGVNAGADVAAVVGGNAGLGLGGNLQTGLDANINAGIGAGSILELGDDPGMIVNKLKIILFSALKASKAFDSVSWNKITKQDLLSLSKTIVSRFGSKLGLKLGIGDVKDVLNLFITADISKGVDANYELFADILLLLLQKQGLLAKLSADLLRSCIEITLTSCLPILKINIDLRSALELALKAVMNFGTSFGIDSKIDAEAAVTAGGRLVAGFELGPDNQADLGADVNADIMVGNGFRLGANLNISVDKLKIILAGSFKASKVFDSNAWSAITRQDLVNLAKTIVARFGSKLGKQLEIADVRDVLNLLLSSDVRKRSDANFELFANISVLLLQKQDLLASISSDLIQSCIEIILSSCSSVLKINVDLKLALDLALKAALNLRDSVDLGMDAKVNTDVGVNAEADVAAFVGIDAGLGLRGNVQAGLDADINAGAILGLGDDAGMILDKLRIIIISALKASKAFDLVAWNSITRQDLLNLSKTIVSRFGSKLGLKLGIADVKNVLNLLISADVSTGSDANCDLFANILLLLIQKQGLLSKLSIDLLGSCIEIMLTSCLSILKINTDSRLALDRAQNVVRNLGASAGLWAGGAVKVLGVDSGASVDTSLGINPGIESGAVLQAGLDSNINESIGAGAVLGLGADAVISDVDKLNFIFVSALKASKAFDSVTWNTITRQDLLSLSKTIVDRFGSKLGIQVGIADVKDVLNLLLSADIKKGTNANCELFANILVVFLQKQGLLANISMNLIRSCIEIIVSSCLPVLKTNVDSELALDQALKAAVNIATSFGLGMSGEVNAGLGLDARESAAADVGLNAGLGVKSDIQAGLSTKVTGGTDVGADIGLGAYAGINFDKIKIILARALKASKAFDAVVWNAISREDILNLSKTIVTRFGSEMRTQLGFADVKNVFNLLISADISKGVDANCELFANVLVLLLQKQGISANISTDFLRSCIEIILTSCLPVLKINVDMGSTVDLGLKAAVNLVTSVGLGINSNAKADLGVDAGATVTAGVSPNAELGLESNIQTDLGSDINVGIGVGAKLGASLSGDSSNNLKKIFLSVLKDSNVFGLLGTRTYPKKVLLILSKTIIALSGKKLGMQLGASDVKDVFNVLVSADFNKGADAYCQAFADIACLLLQKQGISTQISNNLFQSILEILLTSCSLVFKLNIDMNAVLNLASSVDVSLSSVINSGIDAKLGANAGLEPKAGLGADTATATTAGFGLQAGLQLGSDIRGGAEITGSIGSDIGAKFEAGFSGDIGQMFKKSFAVALKQSGVFGLIELQAITRKHLLMLSKTILALSAKILGVRVGASDVKDVFSLLVSVDSNKGVDEYCRALADISYLLLQKQGLVNNLSSNLYQSFLEIIISALSIYFKLNIDIKGAVDNAVNSNASIGVGLEAGTAINAGIGADADATSNAGLEAGAVVNVGQGADANSSVNAGLNFNTGSEVDTRLQAGAGAAMNAGLGANGFLTDGAGLNSDFAFKGNANVDLNAGVQAGVGSGIDINAAVKSDADLRLDVAVQLSAELGKILSSSPELNIALMSGDKDLLLDVMNSAIIKTYGDVAGEAFLSAVKN